MLPTLRRGVRELAGLGPAPWASARKAPVQSFAGRVVEVIQGVHQRFRQVRAVEIAQDHQAQIALRREPDDGLRADGPAVVPDQRSRREEQSRATGEVMSALAAFRGSCSARRALSAPTRPVMARSCSACVSPRESAPDRTNRQVRLPPPDQSVPWQVVRKAEPLAPPMATPLALLPVALKFPLTTANSHLPLSSPPGKPPEPPLALSLS